MSTRARNSFQNLSFDSARLIVLSVLFCVFARQASAQPTPPGGTNSYYYGTPLEAFSFNDVTNWTTDFGFYPISFTNITSSPLGDGTALVVDSTNSAWVNYNVIETDGIPNLTVDVGSVMLWFAPSWSGTNEGGTGPGVWGRLLEVGSTNGAGLWSLYVDPDGVNLYFTVQTNGGDPVTYLSAPIDWTTNYWHEIALTYSPSNILLYLDGWQVTNGAAITNFPDADVLTNGFFIGSDNAGNNQAHGMFDDIYTYDYPVGRDIISGEYMTGQLYIMLNPLNRANFASAPSTPSDPPTLVAITGPGYLQYISTGTNCITSSSLWLTNMLATTAGTNVTFTFEIAGGISGAPYDIFGTAALASSMTNMQWAWMGEGYSCNTYSIPNLPVGSGFFIAASILDSDADGLSDAYERLVSHTDPNVPDTLLDGISDLYKVLHSIPMTNIVAVPSLSSISVQTCAVQ
jgi:hypothetical protein